MTALTTPAPAPLQVYVGHGNPTGDIEVFGLDGATGALSPAPLAVVPSGSSTSFFALHPSRRFAYTTQNRSDRVSAFAVSLADARVGRAGAGGLRKLGDAAVPASPGASEAGPAYVSVDGRGQFLLVANYRGHNAVVFQLGDDGGIGPIVANVSAGKHAHCAVTAPDNRHAFVCHLGADLVAQYRFDPASGALTPQVPPFVATPPGAGPRHLTFTPDGRHALLLNELDATLISYRYDADRGQLTQQQCVPTLPDDYQGRRWGGDIHVHPSGAFVYVSNRAHDSLTVFALADGQASLVERVASGGKTPRNFGLDPAGRFLLVANQDSADLVGFAIDAATGRLTRLWQRAVAENPYFVHIAALSVG